MSKKEGSRAAARLNYIVEGKGPRVALVHGVGGVMRNVMRNPMRLLRTAVWSIAAVLLLSGRSGAEENAIKIGRSYSLGFLPAMVMEEYKLVEKHAQVTHLKDLKVEWINFAGAAAENDALLAGSVAFTGNGAPALNILWDKTRGGVQVRGVGALNSGSQLLNTRNPNVKSIRDFTDKDKIAMPAVKVSIGAILLQMEAAKQFGEANRNRLDPFTVTLSHPDAMAALFSNSEINAHYALEPYSSRELKRPGVHTVLNSDDTLGGQGTLNVYLTTSKFRQENPKIYSAFLNALREADEIIYRDERRAAELYVSKSKGFTVDEIYDLIHNKIVRFTVTPENTMKYADFLYKSGTLKQRPSSWKDLFFPEIHDLAGS